MGIEWTKMGAVDGCVCVGGGGGRVWISTAVSVSASDAALVIPPFHSKGKSPPTSSSQIVDAD